ncbi:MAG: hypothetical protein MK052_02585 [Alphaproteobacteria bacterium]|nr:hypothetical protein [Alphaproteobacteria bacterium]
MLTEPKNDEVLVDDHTEVMREAVGVFPDDKHLLAAIDELELAEFGRHDISVLGNENEMQDVYNRPSRNPYAMENDPSAPRGVFVTPEEKSLADASLVGGGIILAVFLAAPIIGSELPMGMNIAIMLGMALVGGVIGYGVSRILHNHRNSHDRDQERKGGVLLWVSTPTQERETKARDILKRHGARDVHVNQVTRHVPA